MITFNPKEISVPKMHGLLLDAVAPRPIAFACTVDEQGRVNLSPFSFFNVFSANPPILIFSPARRGRDNTTKHTYENVLKVPEVVINIVNYSIVHQTSLASVEYPEGVNEFIKSGLTEEKSMMVKPPRVKESPVAFECKVNQVVSLGDQGAAGNLVICEVLLMHVNENIMSENGRIDPWKLDAVARMGQDYYCRANGESIFVVPKPGEKIKIGIDQLPEAIRKSKLFSMRDLAVLANVERLPFDGTAPESLGNELFQAMAKERLDRGDAVGAWSVLVSS
jgi:flavin reductase (DIM6/NTAB) family NADH-FMN oxidoreductase RutF